MLQWHDLHQRELSKEDLYALLALRNAVFIVEQACPYQDLDGADLAGENRHLLGRRNGELVACARLLAPDSDGAAVKIGRVVIAPRARGLGLGRQLMQQALAGCERHWPGRPVALAAQAHLQPFYAGLGFAAQSEIYLEDNIPHLDMLRIAPDGQIPPGRLS
ncbi:GNAT family N-acetyltransferase [Pantoea sp. 1.19]|uniref:GNAT family N-acetyltransferase n=1 Tax=Pantoea sp. 1.19 TaxID=1925589 RepID=UPI000948A38B|nr:GNAT family N-acetyltransferase [Pantoea sp. 1.19]